MSTPQVVGIIPALNAAKTVRNVAQSLKRAIPEIFIIGIDDGSTDETRDILKVVCGKVIGFDKNRGKGAALRAGFAAAQETDCKAILTIDADGQHDPAFAPQLLDKLSEADIILGTRALNTQTVPIHRRLANMVSSAATRLVARQAIPDSQSGFRAIRREVIDNIHAKGDRYEFETDFLVRAAIAGYTIKGVTVPTIYGPPSHFRTWSDAWRVTRTLWSHRGALFRQ